MKNLAVFTIVLFFMFSLSSCLNSGNKSNGKKVNHADTVYLGDLRDKFKEDSLFFKVVAPDLYLSQFQYCWTITQSEALKKGMTKEYYEKVKQEIAATNEAIKRGIMKGADKNRIPDFQKK